MKLINESGCSSLGLGQHMGCCALSTPQLDYIKKTFFWRGGITGIESVRYEGSEPAQEKELFPRQYKTYFGDISNLGI